MGSMNLERKSGRPVEPDLVFFLMPYERKTVADGSELDFNLFYQELRDELVSKMQMRVERADENGDSSVGLLEAAWDGVDRAGIVVVDLSVPSTSVAMELGWAMCLHKRMVVLAYEGADVPTNVRGQLRPIPYTQDMQRIRKLKEDLKERIRTELRRTDPEMDLKARTGSGAFEATTTVEIACRDHVFVRDINDARRSAELRREDLGYDEMLPEDMATHKDYCQGSTVTGCFVTDDEGRVKFTRRHRQSDPWPRRVSAYLPRQIQSARVTNIGPSGAFIRLSAEGGKSFIPPYQARAAGLAEGDEIQVRITKVDPQQRRIDVALAEAPKANLTEPPEGEYPKVGERFVGTLFDVNLGGGFVKVRLGGYRRLGLLHFTNMSDELWQAMRAGSVTKGSEVHVVVSKVVPSRGRVAQWDIGLEQAADAAELLVTGQPDAAVLPVVPGQLGRAAEAGTQEHFEGDPVA
ncbi:hypothetical protein [Streptomyces sp. NPDC053427]|uniref:hypothetical protein n=1 Tax=Streptomyces sp. NPDC053427 TaxID=3365701 RepID=UPI0037D934A9